MAADEPRATSGDAQWDASSRPPRPGGQAGAGPDRHTPTVGAGEAPGERSLPHWLDPGDEPRARHSARRHLLFVVAAVPWLVVLLWLATASGRAGTSASSLPAPSTSPTTGHPEVPEDGRPPDGAHHPVGTPALRPTAVPDRSSTAGGPRNAVTLADATALASVLARDWLGDIGPRIGAYDEPLLRDAYVDHVAVEAVDHPGTGHVVVTVLALLLRSQEGDYVRAELRRVAVPVAVDGTGARPAGSPWLLRPPELEPHVPPVHELDDPTLVPEVSAALSRAGYGDVEVLRIEGTGGWPFVATVTATAPGEDTPDRHVVWLRPHGNRFVLAGERPEQEGTP